MTHITNQSRRRGISLYGFAKLVAPRLISVVNCRNKSMIDHEEKTIKAFIIKERCDRYLMLLESKKRRNEALNKLNHCKDIDERFMKWLPSNADIVKILKEEGSPEQVYIISAGNRFDLPVIYSSYVCLSANVLITRIKYNVSRYSCQYLAAVRFFYFIDYLFRAW